MLNLLTEKINSRFVQICLGALWLIDGCLQLQPKMFSASFANQVLLPAAQGQPTLVSSPMHWAVSMILVHPALYNLGFILIQLALGLLILWPKTTRIGLITSIVWAVGVWYLGEGLGGLTGGMALVLTGAPGAALLYAVLALAVLPVRQQSKSTKPASWLTYVWLSYWLSGILLLVWSHSTVKSLASMISTPLTNQPGWLAALDYNVGHWFGQRSNWALVGITSMYFVIGLLGLLNKGWRYLAVSLGILVSIFYWFIGQNLGGYYSGLATDLSTAPLVILLGIALLGSKPQPLDIV